MYPFDSLIKSGPPLQSLYTPVPGGDPPINEAERKQIDKLLSSKLSYDNKTAKELIDAVSKKTGLSSDFLAASALQEGMNLAITNPENASTAYSNAKVDPNQYPVDGFYNYGLDTFGDAYKKLVKKGYLPADFNYKAYPAYNEQGMLVNTAAFRNNEEALMAKAAYLKDFMDTVKDEATKRGMELGDRELKYFTMAAYNGGPGALRTMLDEMKEQNVKAYDYIKTGSKKKAGVHKNIQPRMDKMDYFSTLFNTKTDTQ